MAPTRRRLPRRWARLYTIVYRIIIVLGFLLGLLQAACTGRPATGAAGEGASARADALPTQPITHGPFEILPSVRRVSTGTFPNQGGNPFATRPVSEFQLRHRGRPVSLPGGADRWWRILRLEGAPRPALLLVTTGFVLVTEEADGRLQLSPLNSQSSSLAEVQWLDAVRGQPGEPQTFGIEAVPDADAGTRVHGGQWLRIGSRSILDVATLTVHAVDPWVPIVPGVPITALSRNGDTVRAFSPGRTAYVLAASGLDYGKPGQPQAYGLLVVRIADGTAVELRTDRERYRFADREDLTPAWIDHHFSWQRDAQGLERLVPRERFDPWPWRSRLRQMGASRWELAIPRIDAGFVAVLQRLLQAEPGAVVTPAADAPGEALRVTLGGCELNVRAFGRDSRQAADRYIGVWPVSTDVVGSTTPACDAAMRRVAALADAELATGRHEGLLLLGE